MRQDVLGLICAAYGLLLRPSASVLASPVVGASCSPTAGSGPGLDGTGGASSFATPRRQDGAAGLAGGGIDVKRTFRSCLEASTTAKSLTFARASLLPSLGFPSTAAGEDGPTDDDKEGSSRFFAFASSTLGELASRYLDALCACGELPVSRSEWRNDEEKELHLRWAQEEQRRQFGMWSGAPSSGAGEAEVGPGVVDISKRPDCVDDVVALAAAVCAACPECSVQFWSTVEVSPGITSSSVGAAAPPDLGLFPAGS